VGTLWGWISCLLLGVISTAEAGEGSIAVLGGYADQTNVLGVAVAWNRAAPLHESDAWRLTAQLEADATLLNGRRSNAGGYTNLGAFGLTPVLRVEWPRHEYPLFVEGGIGGRMLTHTKLQLEHQFGTAFQFTELVGAGIRFGARNAYEIGVRVEHMSNASIKLPNNGLTAGLLRVAWWF
jgi:hypothetical protein